jgi:hypothetical protein
MRLGARMARRRQLGFIKSKKDLPKLTFLSRKTDPTEEEARRALCRVLRNKDQNPPVTILEALARVFDPDLPKGGHPWLKAVLKKRTQGHSNPYQNIAIAEKVLELILLGKTYEDAIERVAEITGKSQEHVKRIYGKYPGRENFPKPPRRARKPRK